MGLYSKLPEQHTFDAEAQAWGKDNDIVTVVDCRFTTADVKKQAKTSVRK